MRTTVDIHDALLERAKTLAAETGRRLGDVVDDALREMFHRREQDEHRKPSRVQLHTYGGSGFAPGIDPNSYAGLVETLDEEHRDPATGRLDLNKLR